MALYERIMGLEQPKISPHTILAVCAEFVRGRLTKAQVDSILSLSAGEVVELQTLVDTVTGSAVAKLARVIEIQDVLLLAEGRFPPSYDTAANVKLRLGV